MEKLNLYVGKVNVFFFYFIFAQDLFFPKYAYSQNNNHLFIICIIARGASSILCSSFLSRLCSLIQTPILHKKKKQLNCYS